MTAGEGEGAREPIRSAHAVLDRFLTAFSAADLPDLLGAFWPEALVWGTTMPDLAETPEEVRAYFAPLGRRGPGERLARWLTGTAVALSDAVVLFSGTWHVEAADQVTAGPFRISLAVTRRGDAWRIAQFHNSPRPSATG